MTVGDLGGPLGMQADRLDIVGKVGAERCNAHGAAIAIGAAAAENGRRDDAPIVAVPQLAEDVARHRAVPASWIPLEIDGKAVGQVVLIDRAMPAQRLDDADRHHRIVGEVPGRHREGPSLDKRQHDVRLAEELLAEGIADGEAFQRELGPLQRGHGVSSVNQGRM